MPIRPFIAMLLLAPLTLAQETAPPLFAADTPIIDYQNPQLPDLWSSRHGGEPRKISG